MGLDEWSYSYLYKTIENGTIVIRDGLIKSVGERIKIPNQATIIDLKGKHVYAGFIESWLM